jgi:hypothetical protein
MRSFTTSFCAVVVGLVAVTAIQAGPGKGSKAPSSYSKMSSSSYKTNSSSYKNYSSKYYCYKNCYKCDWSYRCYCRDYCCWLFYDPCCQCRYYWYSPGCCWYPESYMTAYPPVAGEAAPEITNQIPEAPGSANGTGPVVTSGPSQLTKAIKPATTTLKGDTEAR